MGFLDYYDSYNSDTINEAQLGTGAGIANKIDDLRSWINKDKKKGYMPKDIKLQRGNITGGRPFDDENPQPSTNDTPQPSTNDTPQPSSKEPSSKKTQTTEAPSIRLSEFGGKGGKGWWYLFASPDIIDSLTNKIESEENSDMVVKKTPLRGNKFLDGYKYLLKPLDGEEHKPNKYRSVYLVKDKINAKDTDTTPDFGFVIFDGKQSFVQANKTFMKGAVNKLYGNAQTASQLLKFSQPRPSDVADNPVFYNSFKDIPTEHLPQEHVIAITDLLDELKGQEDDVDSTPNTKAPVESTTDKDGKTTRKQKHAMIIAMKDVIDNNEKLSKIKTTYDAIVNKSKDIADNMSSETNTEKLKELKKLRSSIKSRFYRTQDKLYKSIQDTRSGANESVVSFTSVWNETIHDSTVAEMLGEGSGYLLNDIIANVGNKLFKGLGASLRKNKPKKVNIKDAGGLIKFASPNKIYDVSSESYVATNTACAQSLVEYTQVKKENGMLARAMLNVHNTFITKRMTPVITSDDPEQLQQGVDKLTATYNLKEPFTILEIAVWMTTNRGYVMTMLIEENINEASEETDTEGPQKIKALRGDGDIVYFVGCTPKGEEFFKDTFDMSLKQYLRTTAHATKSILKKMSDDISKKNSVAADRADGGSDADGGADGDEKSFIKRSANERTYLKIRAKLKNVLNTTDADKTVEKYKSDDDNVKGMKVHLNDGGEIAMYKDNKTQEYFIILNNKASKFFKDNKIDDINAYQKQVG